MVRLGVRWADVGVGERALVETKGIFEEEERRPMRAGSWGRPSVKMSFAGSVIMPLQT